MTANRPSAPAKADSIVYSPALPQAPSATVDEHERTRWAPTQDAPQRQGTEDPGQRIGSDRQPGKQSE